MFDYNGYIHVFSPGTGTDNPSDQTLFVNSIILSVWSFAARVPPLNDFITVFPIQKYR